MVPRNSTSLCDPSIARGLLWSNMTVIPKRSQTSPQLCHGLWTFGPLSLQAFPSTPLSFSSECLPGYESYICRIVPMRPESISRAGSSVPPGEKHTAEIPTTTRTRMLRTWYILSAQRLYVPGVFYAPDGYLCVHNGCVVHAAGGR